MAIDNNNLEALSQAMVVQKGLQQFDQIHRAAIAQNEKGEDWLICPTCKVDFPCERMLLFMMLQGIASFTAMIPSGNMANILKRFTGT